MGRFREKNTYAAKAEPFGMGGSTTHEVTKKKRELSPIHQLLSQMRDHAGRRKAVLVLENIEHILDRKEVVEKVQNILLALDDPTLGEFKVKVCMVGVPGEIKDVLAAGNKYQTISNRVTEIPEVERLPKLGVRLFLQIGLQQELGFDVISKDFCYTRVIHVSDRVPQYIHDICLQLSMLAEENADTITPELVSKAFDVWVQDNARQTYEFLCEALEKKGPMSPPLGRIVWAISELDGRRFNTGDVENVLRKKFPKSTDGKRIQTLRTLRQLSEGEDRLLRADEASMIFRLTTPKLKPILRANLEVDEKHETVHLKRL